MYALGVFLDYFLALGLVLLILAVTIYYMTEDTNPVPRVHPCTWQGDVRPDGTVVQLELPFPVPSSPEPAL